MVFTTYAASLSALPQVPDIFPLVVIYRNPDDGFLDQAELTEPTPPLSLPPSALSTTVWVHSSMLTSATLSSLRKAGLVYSSLHAPSVFFHLQLCTEPFFPVRPEAQRPAHPHLEPAAPCLGWPGALQALRVHELTWRQALVPQTFHFFVLQQP